MISHISAHDPTDPIDHIVRETGENPTWSIIWLHGLGADGTDFVPLVPELGFTDHPAIRFLFPHAPVRPITLNGGMEMRGWYDLRGMAFDREEDRAGLEQSQDQICRLIAHENRRGTPTNRILLAGFSQGGAVSLFTGLRHPEPLAGVIALSTYLPVAESTRMERSQANARTPIFMAHGSLDPVIPVTLAERSRQWLESMEYTVDWHTYPMPHMVHPEEIAQIRTFLQHQGLTEPGTGPAK